MTSFNGKQLKKVVKQLRAAGVKSYKCAEFEIELTQDTPTIVKRSRKSKTLVDTSPDKITSDDTLTGDQLLYWSTTGDPDTLEEEKAVN